MLNIPIYTLAQHLWNHSKFAIPRDQTVIMISFSLIILLIFLSTTITWIFRKFRPYVKFSEKYKHRSGFPLELMKIGYEGAIKIKYEFDQV